MATKSRSNAQVSSLEKRDISAAVRGTKVCRYNWHSAVTVGWPFPIYFSNKIYTKQFLSNSTRKWLCFEKLIAVLKINLLCYLLQFSAHFRSLWPSSTKSDTLIQNVFVMCTTVENFNFLKSNTADGRHLKQEAQLSPRDRAMRRVNWNLGVVRGHSRSTAMSPFDRAHTTSYSTLIETMCLSCTVFEI